MTETRLKTKNNETLIEMALPLIRRSALLTPHTFLLNSDCNIIWQKATYVIGDEDEIYEQLIKLSKK